MARVNIDILQISELKWTGMGKFNSDDWQLYGGANGDLLQEDSCHIPFLPGLLQPEPLSVRQVTADPCLHRRHSNPQRQVWLSLLWGSLLLSFHPGMHKVLFVLSDFLWWIWDFILNMIAPLLLCYRDFSFAFGFFVEIQHSPVDGCSAASCDFGVLTGEDECTSLYSAILLTADGRLI